MVVDEDPFPLVTIVNTLVVTNLKGSLAIEKAREQTPILKFKKFWVLKKYILLINEPLTPVVKARKEGGSPINAACDCTKMVR